VLKLPIYRLTPLEDTKASLLWRSTTLHPKCLWIRTPDEYEARHAVGRATAARGTADGLFSPWYDEALVACAYDDDADVPAGIIRVRGAVAPPCHDDAQATMQATMWC
jgi:hypothetical protein